MAPYLLILFFSLPFFKNFTLYSQEFFDKRYSFKDLKVLGPIPREGMIRFREQIPLSEVVKRVGGLKYNYTLSKKDKLIPFKVFSNQNSSKLDITPFLKKLEKTDKKYFNKSKYSFFKRKSYHDKIRKGVEQNSGEKDERKRTRYR